MLDTLSILWWTFSATPLTYLPHQQGQRVWVSVCPCAAGAWVDGVFLLPLYQSWLLAFPLQRQVFLSVSFSFLVPSCHTICSLSIHVLKKQNKLMQLIDPLFCCLFLPKFDPLNVLQNSPNLANRSTLEKCFIKWGENAKIRSIAPWRHPKKTLNGPSGGR